MTHSTSQEVFAAARHLPWEAMLVIHDFAWDDYEELLEVIGDRPGLRVSYDDGRLEILSPSPKREKFSRVPDLFVTAFCEVRGLNCEVYGSATWKSRELAKSVEPDACYYVKNADRVVGKKDIQLGSYPPPDIAVEIDISNSSLKKLAIYAAIGVSEVWRYEGRAFTFYALTRGHYSEIQESRQLPGFTGAMLLEAMEDSETRGPIPAVKAFRRSLRAKK